VTPSELAPGLQVALRWAEDASPQSATVHALALCVHLVDALDLVGPPDRWTAEAVGLQLSLAADRLVLVERSQGMKR
jgi:hypothetical protein